jgi:hypothetical protein
MPIKYTVESGRLVALVPADQELDYWRRRAARVLGLMARARRAAALRRAVADTRPWSDRLAVADALSEVMSLGEAGMIAERLEDLPRATSDDEAVALAVEAYHAVRADHDPSSDSALAAATARELIAFGVPPRTAYRLANERGMKPWEVADYAMRRVARLLDSDRRMRGGSRRETARKWAARRNPRPSAVGG